MIAPNASHDIEALIPKYQNEWNKTQHENDDGAFVRAIATELNIRDPRWGLNAKRDGSSNDVSKDALAYYVGPTDRHVEVYDFIIGHEGAGAHIGWLDQTNYQTMGNQGTARFVHPRTSGGYEGSPSPNPNPTPNPTPGPRPTPSPTNPMLNLVEAVNRVAMAAKHELSEAEIQKFAARARELGWNGGGSISAAIVNTIISELNKNVESVTVVCRVTEDNPLFPTGTQIKIVVG